MNNILHGFGDLTDLLPSPDYDRIVPDKTVEERIRDIWAPIVGEDYA